MAVRSPAVDVLKRLSTGLACLLLAGPVPAAVTFTPASIGLPGSNAGYDCSPFNPGGWVGVAFADVDGDGDDDLGVVGRLLIGTRIFISDGAGSWTESSTGLDQDCHGRSDVDFADIDGDGDPDIGGIGGVNGGPAAFRNDGGSWTPVSNGLATTNGEGFAFGDFDGDGNADLATVGHFSGGTRAFFGDGAGNWVEMSAGLEPTLGGHRADAGDFDGDGIDEIVGTQFGTFDPLQDGIRVWKYDPVTMTWSAIFSAYFDQPYGVAAADANGDGWNDVIVAAAQDVIGTPGSVHVFLNQGAGRGFVEASNGLPVMDAFLGDLAVGDLDNDGDLDIATGDWAGWLRIFTGDGAGNWVEETATGLGPAADKTEGVAIGDLDNDCRNDVSFASYRSGIRTYASSTPVACPILAEAGLSRVICGKHNLDASASRACNCPNGPVYRWWEGGSLLRDWSPDPRIAVTPSVTTLYRLDVACAGQAQCFVSDGITMEVSGGSAPPALGNVLLLAKSPPSDIRFAWTDLAVPTGDYQLLALPEAQGPPSQAVFDGPLPSILGSAPPGTGQIVVIDGVVTPPGLVYYRVRALSTCGGIAGPA